MFLLIYLLTQKSLCRATTPIDTYVSYALNRIFDTGVGVIAAFAVNYFLPRARVVALRSRVEGLFKK